MKMNPANNAWILLVEDDVIISDLLEVILNGFGYNIVMAVDGEQALKIYQTHLPKFDLVISDLGLPKLGGVELFAKLFSENPKLKFIATSGFGGIELKTNLKRMGVKAFIQKPYVPEELFAIIDNVIFEKGE